MGASRVSEKLNMERRAYRSWPIFVLILVWFIFASPYLLKGLIPFPSKYLVTFFPPWSAAYGMPLKNNAMPDVITQIYPWKKLTIDTWKQGRIPFWNPYSFAGTPHLANYQTAVFSPFNLLFLFLKQIDAWSWLVLLQPLLAGIFMYLFLRSLDRSKPAAVLGSLAFMFCGFIVVWMAYATLAYAVLWLPFILFVINRFLKKTSWWFLLSITAAVAFSFFSGHFQISLYVAGTVLVYILFTFLIAKNWIKTGLLFGFFILGIFLSLPQLLPSFMAYINSVRSISFAKGEIIPWQYLITMLAPDFYGNPVTRNDWFGHYAEWAGYIGVVPLLLAGYGLFRKKAKQEWFFIILGLTAVILAYPTWFNDLLFQAKVPVLSTSSASRIIVIFSFSLAVLAAFGLDKVWQDWKNRALKPGIFYFLLIVILLAAFWLGLVMGKPLPPDKLSIAKRNLLLPTLTVLATVLFSLSGYFRFKTKRLATLCLAVLLVLTAYDLLRFASKWMPFDPREYVFPQMEVTAFLQKKVGIDRVFGNFGNELGSYFAIPGVEGYDALYSERYGKLVSAMAFGQLDVPQRSVVLLPKKGRYTEEFLELLGVKYVLHRGSDGRNVWAYPVWEFPQYRSIYADQYYEVFENTAVLPRVFLASDYKLIHSDQEIITALFSPQLNRRQTLILEEKPQPEPQEAGEGRVEIARYRSTEIVMQVDTPAPKLLFLSDTYDPGWKAWIDQSPAKIYRADYDFRAIAVPSGRHLVRLSYEPQAFRWAMFIAGGVIFILLGGSIYALKHENWYL